MNFSLNILNMKEIEIDSQIGKDPVTIIKDSLKKMRGPIF
jgi:hypothetical protein